VVNILTFVPSKFERSPEKYGGAYVFLYNLVNQSYQIDMKWHTVTFELKVSSPYVINFIKGMVILLRALLDSLKIIKAYRINLIFSAIEVPHPILLAYITSRLTRRPWVALLHSVPCYGLLPRGRNISNIRFSTSFVDIFKYTQNVHKYPLIKTFMVATSFYVIFKLLRFAHVMCINTVIMETLRKPGLRFKSIGHYFGVGVNMSEINSIISDGSGMKYDALFAGRLHGEKGLFDCVEVWRRVSKDYPAAKLALIGKGNKKTIKKLKDIITKYDMEKNIVLLSDPLYGAGHTEVLKAMKQCRLLIYPSRKDVSPTVIAEALALGLPVVTYELSSIKHAYGDFATVFFSKVGDVEHLAKLVIHLIGNDEELKELSLKAVQRRHKLDINNVLKVLRVKFIEYIKSYQHRN